MTQEKKISILIVEDSADDAELLIRFLKRGGYSFSHAIVSEREGYIRTLKSREWDVILCDFTMPHFNGKQALEVLKQLEIDIPFIFVSGTIGEDVAVEAMQAGANDYVLKGNLKRLLPAIERELKAAEIRRERKHAIDHLKENEEKLRNIIDHSTNMFYSHTADHVLTFVSPQVKSLLGYEPEEAMIRWTDFLTDNPVNEIGIQATDRAMETGVRQPPYELEMRRQDGRIIWVEARESPVVQNGKTVAMVGSLVDKTERRNAEKALMVSEERFRRLAENAQDIIYRYRLKPDRGFEYVSPSATVITGYTPEEHYADPDLAMKLVYQEDRSLLDAIFGSSNSFKEPLVLRWIRKDGKVIWTEQRNVPILDQDGEVVAIEGIARDFTQRKEWEDSMREKTEEIERFNRLAVGRELHMVDLKKQVNELSIRLGSKPPYDLKFLEGGSDTGFTQDSDSNDFKARG